MLIFDPEATLEGIGANLAFMDEFAQHPHNFCRAEVYAGTPLKAILESQGRLRGDYRAWTYEMRDPRVELLFRLFSTAWATRNFKPDGVANLMMGVRFDAEVVRRFYPDAWDADWHRDLVGLTERVNRDSVVRMREALAFSVGVDLRDHAAAKAFALGLARDVARADLGFLGEIKRHRREMERRIALAGGPLAQRRFEGGRPPWAAETGRLGSSAGTEYSTEVLPAPSEV
jgi:hypothetical protein